MTHSDGVVTMEIIDCKPSDSGKYTCKATNVHGTDETECVVIVEDRKYIEQHIHPTPPPIVISRQFHSSSDSQQHTSSSSTSTAQHNSSNYSSNIQNQSSSISSSKTVNHSSSSSADTSKSTTKKNKYGGSSLTTPGSPSRSRSATKELILPPDDSLMCKPEFSKPLTDITVGDGEQLVLTCIVKGDPEPQITWSKNGKAISSSEIMDLKYKNGTASLTIKEIFPEDEGVFTCTATNSIGSVETKSKLTVKPMEKNSAKRHTSGDKPPKIVSHLESRFVKDGEAVTLACRIIGAEHFDVVWLHNNKEIKPSKDFQYTNEANIYKLQVAEIFPEDAGTYTCEAFNDAGESFSTCTINVLVPGEEPKQPAFVKFPSSVTVQAGEISTFECETSGDSPLLQLTWLKDGKAIDETSQRYTFTKDGNKYKFNIVKSNMDDVGQYQAKAIGKKGETFGSFSVNVYSTES